MRTRAALDSSPHLIKRSADFLVRSLDPFYLQMTSSGWSWDLKFLKSSYAPIIHLFFVFPPLAGGDYSILGSRKSNFHASSSPGYSLILARTGPQQSRKRDLMTWTDLGGVACRMSSIEHIAMPQIPTTYASMR